MLRVLHIGLSNNLGGVENFIINLYRNIDKSLVQFDFILYNDKEELNSNVKPLYYDEIKKNGGKIYNIVSRRKNIYKNYKQLKDIIVNNNYKIVHFHVVTLSYITPIILCNQLKDVKIILHSHSDWKGNNLKTKLLHNINTFRIKNKNYVKFACSYQAGKWLYGNTNFTIIKNGININRFKFNEEKRVKVRKELNIKDNEFILGHIGRFLEVKNHDFLIDIIKGCQKLDNNIKLLCIGEGELKEKIRDKINLLGLKEKVILLDNKDNIEEYYSAMDLFLLPSLFEGLAFVLVEAQANGLNCIVSDNVAKESNITDKLVFLSTKNGVDEWVKKIFSMDFKRYNLLEIIKNNGYDIKETANKVQSEYFKLVDKNNLL